MKTLLFFSAGFVIFLPMSEAQQSQTPTSFILFSQKLSELDTKDSQQYILKLRRQLKNTKNSKLEKKLHSNSESLRCQKLKRPSCRQALYGKDLCIPPQKVASDYCEKVSKSLRKKPAKDPLFDRLPWNKWALSINQLCNQKLTATCQKLADLHNKYEDKHQKKQNRLKKSLAQ